MTDPQGRCQDMCAGKRSAERPRRGHLLTSHTSLPSDLPLFQPFTILPRSPTAQESPESDPEGRNQKPPPGHPADRAAQSSSPSTGSGSVPALCSSSRQPRAPSPSTDQQQLESPPRLSQCVGLQAQQPPDGGADGAAVADHDQRAAVGGSFSALRSAPRARPGRRPRSPAHRRRAARARRASTRRTARRTARRSPRASAPATRPRTSRAGASSCVTSRPVRAASSRGRGRRPLQVGGDDRVRAAARPAAGRRGAPGRRRSRSARCPWSPGSGAPGSTRSGRAATGRRGGPGAPGPRRAGHRTPSLPPSSPRPRRRPAGLPLGVLLGLAAGRLGVLGQLELGAVLPQPLQRVEDALLAVLDVHDDVDVVEQHPAGRRGRPRGAPAWRRAPCSSRSSISSTIDLTWRSLGAEASRKASVIDSTSLTS